MLRAFQSSCENSLLLSFRGAAGDEESRRASKILGARLLAEFTLSEPQRFFASLRMTSEGLGMTVQREFSHILFTSGRRLEPVVRALLIMP
jgi:hypothetical protein